MAIFSQDTTETGLSKSFNNNILYYYGDNAKTKTTVDVEPRANH